jgi:hypothetical protein
MDGPSVTAALLAENICLWRKVEKILKEVMQTDLAVRRPFYYFNMFHRGRETCSTPACVPHGHRQSQSGITVNNLLHVGLRYP